MYYHHHYHSDDQYTQQYMGPPAPAAGPALAPPLHQGAIWRVFVQCNYWKIQAVVQLNLHETALSFGYLSHHLTWHWENTVDLLKMSPVILSSVSEEFRRNSEERWQYYWRYLIKIHCIHIVVKQIIVRNWFSITFINLYISQ